MLVSVIIIFWYLLIIHPSFFHHLHSSAAHIWTSLYCSGSLIGWFNKQKKFTGLLFVKLSREAWSRASPLYLTELKVPSTSICVRFSSIHLWHLSVYWFLLISVKSSKKMAYQNEWDTFLETNSYRDKKGMTYYGCEQVYEKVFFAEVGFPKW